MTHVRNILVSNIFELVFLYYDLSDLVRDLTDVRLIIQVAQAGGDSRRGR